MSDKRIKTLEFDDCKCAIFNDGSIMVFDRHAEHINYLSKEETKELIKEYERIF